MKMMLHTWPEISWKLKGETVYQQAMQGANGICAALGQASHRIPHIRPLPAPRSAIFGKQAQKKSLLGTQKQRRSMNAQSHKLTND